MFGVPCPLSVLLSLTALALDMWIMMSRAWFKLHPLTFCLALRFLLYPYQSWGPDLGVVKMVYECAVQQINCCILHFQMMVGCKRTGTDTCTHMHSPQTHNVVQDVRSFDDVPLSALSSIHDILMQWEKGRTSFCEHHRDAAAFRSACKTFRSAAVWPDVLKVSSVLEEELLVDFCGLVADSGESAKENHSK